MRNVWLDLLTPFLAVTEEPSPPSEVGIGAVVTTLAITAFLVWASYLILSSRRSEKPVAEETPQNLQPGMSDDEMENNRLTRVLGTAVV